MQSPTDAKPPEGTTFVPLPPGNGRLLFRQVRRIVVFVLGISVVMVGIVMIVTPGPACVVIPLGLGILATEFLWAERLMHSLKRQLLDAHAAASQVALPRWVRFFLPKKNGGKATAPGGQPPAGSQRDAPPPAL
ncbi:MAG: PGPGW domain-containing protein [Deltaproteobacteria bacterium]